MSRIILLTDLSEEYAKKLLKGIVGYSKQHGSWVLCKMPFAYYTMHGLDGVLQWAKTWKADGIIGQFYNTDDVGIFRRNGIVAMAQDFKARFTEIPNITGDHELMGRLCANYFIQKGFKNFAFYGFHNIVWSLERSNGFFDEIRTRLHNAFMVEYNNPNDIELWTYEQEPLIEWLQRLPKPIALMTCDDNQGHHIAELCKLIGIKIPEEIALLGVDNDEAVCSLSDPPLSSLEQAVEQGGYEAARLMEQLIDNPDMPYRDIVVMPSRIITRKSTDIYATTDKHVLTALLYIHENIDRKLTIKDILQRVPLSRRLLENRFREETGMPIYNYITHLRIERFANQLIESTRSISDIVCDMDYIEYKNMARLFKKMKGCTPSQYRQQYGSTV